MNLRSDIFLITLCAMLLSCGGAPVVKAPSAEAVVGEKMSCVAVKDPLNPYIIEWSPADTAALVLRAQEGLVVVSYDGCRNLKVLTDCEVAGEYTLKTLTTPIRGSKRISKVTDLMAELPLAAAKLKARVAFGQTIELKTAVSGMLKTKARPTSVPNTAECAGANHVVVGLTVGTFQLTQHGQQSASAGASVAAVGAEAGTSSSATAIADRGDPAKCIIHGPGCDTPFRIKLKKMTIAAAPAVAATPPASTTPVPPPVSPAPTATAVAAPITTGPKPFDKAAFEKLLPRPNFEKRLGRILSEETMKNYEEERRSGGNFGWCWMLPGACMYMLGTRGHTKNILFGAMYTALYVAGIVNFVSDTSLESRDNVAPSILLMNAGILGHVLHGYFAWDDYNRDVMREVVEVDGLK